jgi:septal ring factor EnvC (AmiA/AmiB activator)
MKNFVLIISLMFFFLTITKGQTRKELEVKREKTLEDISYIDNLLKETTKQKSSNLNELKIIGNRLNLRESVILGMREEMNLLNSRINLNTVAIEMMERDLVILKQDYSKYIVNSYKSSKGNPEIGYLLSARDFNQGYKRLRYLQQITKFRRRETEIIENLKDQIEETKNRLQEDLYNISDLKSKEEKQKNFLQQEQNKKKKAINSLGNKEKQLKKDLEEKKRIAQKIETEIARVIEEERKKNTTSDLTPEQILIGADFVVNKGRLPWPVERGIITSQFGLQKHPVLTYVTEDNPGIEITSSGKTIVRSVFKGTVTRVFTITGANWAIIIRHGKYLTVYQNLVNVKVKKGDSVETKQEIGEVFCDMENGEKSILKFWIFEEKNKINPEIWIAKK